jgi:hypothetical protein
VAEAGLDEPAFRERIGLGGMGGEFVPFRADRIDDVGAGAREPGQRAG